MPQASEELRSQWRDDGEAMDCLEEAGFKLSRTKHGFWLIHQMPNLREWSALQYLCDEWDYCYEILYSQEPEDWLALSIE